MLHYTYSARLVSYLLDIRSKSETFSLSDVFETQKLKTPTQTTGNEWFVEKWRFAQIHVNVATVHKIINWFIQIFFRAFFKTNELSASVTGSKIAEQENKNDL
jgi:phage host-nuclease inhibitor protein Gam